MESVFQFNFKASNNGAKYEAFITRLWLAKELEVKDLVVFFNSQLIVGQVRGEYEDQDLIWCGIYKNSRKYQQPIKP